MRDYSKFLIIGLILLGFHSNMRATETNNQSLEEISSDIRFDDQGQLTYLRFRKDNRPNFESFFNEFNNLIGLDQDHRFIEISRYEDQLGFLHIRYRQTFMDYDVAYTNLILHLKEGKVISFNGNYRTDINQQESKISENEALIAALNYINADTYEWDLENNEQLKPKGELMYLSHAMTGNGNSNVLVYRFSIFSIEPFNRSYYYINAINSEVEFVETQMHSGGDSKGVAVTGYSDTQNIITDSLGSFFVLADSLRGNGILTYDIKRSRNYSSATLFRDSNNFWNNFNANLDEFATDAHWATERMYDYMEQMFNRNSIDDKGVTLKSYVHLDVDLFNAFWDGGRMAAAYGDGSATTNPLTTIDIVGHEIAHGLTDFTSDLIYANESGALNESFSDIFGTTLEFYARPSKSNWEIGEDVGGAIRSMINPKQYGDPDTYGGQNWIDQNCVPTAGNDRCGVHTNSGVQNHWFYLLSQGGTGVNDLADTFNVTGIGMAKAEQIAYRMQAAYLTPSSNHSDAQFYGIISAIDLYGSCSPEVESTTNAWYAVGLGTEYVPGVRADFTSLGDTAYCTDNAVIQFESTGSNIRNFRWDFGNGDTSNLRNPSVVYNGLGSYTVTLIAEGDTCGSDTVVKSNYIKLDTNISCAYFLGDSVQEIKDVCSGRIYDSGGFGADYKTNEDGVIHLSIDGVDFIELVFESNDIEAGDVFSCNRDYIEIFDGATTDAKSLGRYCKNFLPLGNVIHSTSNNLTIRFHSDNSVPAEGFLISWNCMMANSLALADFRVDRDTSCNGIVKFENLSSNKVSNIQWDFGDGGFSNELNPTHIYNVNGSFDVRMVVENSHGKNAITKFGVVHVNRPDLPEISTDTICYGQTDGLKINSLDNIQWYRDTNSAPFFNGDSLTLVNLRQDTSFFIRSIDDNRAFNLGPLRGTGEYSSSNDYIEFDVLNPVRIESIVFFSERAGIRTLDIRNRFGAIVESKEIFIPNGALQVTIDIALQPDSNYRISISDRDNALFRNTSGATFPYEISDLIKLKGSNMTSGGYPYFFRWKVSHLACESVFERVSAKVDSSNFSLSKDTVCDQINWNGNLITSSGRYRYNEVDSTQCDRVEVLEVEVLSSSISNVRDTVCDQYTWSQNGQTYNASGIYTDVLMNAIGCDSVIRLILEVDSSTTSVQKETSCFTYEWTRKGITYTESGSYFDTIPNGIGCDSILELDLTIYNLDLSITKRGFDLISNQEDAKYQWLDCEDNYAPLINDTNFNFRASENGLYAVEIEQNGCIDTTNCVRIAGVGINENEIFQGVMIMPNPVNDKLYINFGAQVNSIQNVRLINGVGQELRIWNNSEFSQANRLEIEFSNYSKGIYFVQLIGDQGQRTQRIIKLE